MVFVSKCLKRILKIYCLNTIRNEDLWEITKFKKLDVMIKRRKLNWISCTIRRLSVHTATLSLFIWNSQGSRKRVSLRYTTTWKRTVIHEPWAVGSECTELPTLALGQRIFF